MVISSASACRLGWTQASNMPIATGVLSLWSRCAIHGAVWGVRRLPLNRRCREWRVSIWGVGDDFRTSSTEKSVCLGCISVRVDCRSFPARRSKSTSVFLLQWSFHPFSEVGCSVFILVSSQTVAALFLFRCPLIEVSAMLSSLWYSSIWVRCFSSSKHNDDLLLNNDRSFGSFEVSTACGVEIASSVFQELGVPNPWSLFILVPSSPERRRWPLLWSVECLLLSPRFVSSPVPLGGIVSCKGSESCGWCAGFSVG